MIVQNNCRHKATNLVISGFIQIVYWWTGYEYVRFEDNEIRLQN